MGFGLHVGWGIEGAIGSEYKIDPSYLSPNVNLASRLESATKQFGTTVLMSDAFAACLSPAVRSMVRGGCPCMVPCVVTSVSAPFVVAIIPPVAVSTHMCICEAVCRFARLTEW